MGLMNLYCMMYLRGQILMVASSKPVHQNPLGKVLAAG